MRVPILFPLFIWVLLLNAQTPTGTIIGWVTDPTGASVAGARIELTNAATGQKREALSEASGAFRLPDVPVGAYSFVVEAKGFKRHLQNEIEVPVNRNVTVNALLEVGQLSESVTVTTAPPQVDVVSGALSSVVGPTEAKELPLNGRNVLQLMTLNPGITAAVTNHGVTGNPNYSVNGARGDHVNFLLDGATNNDDQNNVSNYFPNPDAVQEFSVLTNGFSAEYGNAAGGVVNAVTKSGTNRLHGSAFEFVRNEKLNAADFFSHQRDTLKRNQFGGTIGGPVLFPRLYNGHDKTFFFYSYQSTRLRTAPTNRTTFVPTAAERAGDFSNTSLAKPLDANGQPFVYQGQANVLNPALFDPVIIRMLNATVPLPNAGGNVLRYTSRSKQDNYEHLGRVDHALTSKDKLTARFFYFNFASPAIAPDTTPTGVNIFTASGGTANQAANAVLSDTHLFSPTLLNNVTLDYNRLVYNAIAPYTQKNFCDFGRQMFCFQGGLRFNTPQFGFPGETNSFNPAQSYRAADSVNWVRNRHSLKFGVDIRHVQSDMNTDSGGNGFPSITGQITGNAFADMLLGYDAADNRQAPSRQRLRGTFQSYFAQDDFRVSSHFTLNLGLRWDPYNPWTEVDNKLKTFSPAAYSAGAVSQQYPNGPPGLLFVGDPGVSRSLIGARYKQFAPRVGFAFDPSGNGRTSIRGGYGIFFDQQVEPVLLQRQQNDPPYNLGLFLFGVPFGNPFQGQPDPYGSFTFPPNKNTQFIFPLGTIAALSPDFHPAYLQQWNLTVERQLAKDLLLRVSYVGTKGTRLQETRNIDPAIYIPGQSTVANTNNRRIFAPDYGPITLNYSDGLSIYHALQTTFEKRISHGVQFNANYTWSRSIDLGSSTLQGGDCCGSDIPQNPLNIRADRGLSSFDIQHRFVASGIWDVPAPRWNKVSDAFLRGWEATPILTIVTGSPLNIITGQDRSFSANGFDRPDVTGNPVLSNSRSKQDKIAKYFDPSVFVLNPIGQFGNLGRNAVRGPGSINLDAGLFKNFRIKEYGRVQFRWEMFNATNHVNLGNPTATLGLNLGRILSTRGSRIMQLSLKYEF